MKTKLFLFLIFNLLLMNNFLLAQVSLTLIETYDISDNVAEPSGLAFDSVNNQLFMVSDSDDIFRVSITGNVLDTYSFSGDLEGVSMFNIPNTLLVAIEDSRILVEYNYVTGNSSQHAMSYSNMGSSSSGIEGVTYNSTTGEIYFLNEKNPGALIVANSNFVVTNEFPLNFAGDYSASFYVEETGFLWLGSDNSSTIYKCTTTGVVMDTIPVADNNGDDLDKLEGIAIDHVNQLLYAVTDSGGELLVYEINDSTLGFDDGSVNNSLNVFSYLLNSELLNIKLHNYDNEEYLIQVYDITGKLNVVQSGNTDSSIINIGDLPLGVYFVRVTVNADSVIKKFIKK